jgi:hypothetical protein
MRESDGDCLTCMAAEAAVNALTSVEDVTAFTW